jgi:arylsulfatase A-like enzyme
MTRRSLTLLLLLWLNGQLAAAAASPSTSASAVETQPNILFIYLDDFGWRDAGFMGSDFYETPHLDRLADEGMVFTDAYACAANCAPSRACLLSGQYTPRHEIYNVGTRPRGNAKHRRLLPIPGKDTLDPGISTWAHQLQSVGYRTAIMGKWHLSPDPKPYGFDVNVGGTHAGSPPRGYYPPHPNAPGLGDAPPGEYLTDRLSSEAIAFIKANQDQPWTLYLSHFAVHTPLDAKDDLVAKYQVKPPGTLHSHVAMATMIQAVDDGVGRILKTLEELQLDTRTVIFFSSDNGGYGPATDMAPLKGYKGTYYEGGIRVPLLVRWPGVVAPGSRCAVPVTGVDLYPTLCNIAEAPLPQNQPLDGESLLPLLTGSTALPAFGPGERALYWHFPAYLQSYQVYNEQRDPLFRSRPCSIIRIGQWKLHQYFEEALNEAAEGIELYDLLGDPGEQNNLAKRLPAKTRELLERLTSWRRQIHAPLPQEPNPDFDAAAEAAAIASRSVSRSQPRKRR